jgi:drug/metabolite transporter (DMT)-like permease
VTRSYVPLISILAALWGASYLLIKIGIRGFEPATMMEVRLAAASAILVGFLALRGELRALRQAPLGAYALGLLNGAIPFTLIAWGEKHVDSGTAAVANSGVPLFVALLAPFVAHGERVGGLRLGGLGLGFGGVAWLVGLHPSADRWFLAGTAAILVATLSYAFGSLYGQHLVARTSGPVLATTAYLGAALVLLPLGAAQAPHRWPGWEPLAAVLALSLLGTAVAQLLWFRLLVRYGSSRSTLVSYLLPAVALVYGSVFLGEPLGVAKLGGFALVLAGVVLASGAVRTQSRSAEIPVAIETARAAAPVASTSDAERPASSTPASPNSAPALASTESANTVLLRRCP